MAIIKEEIKGTKIINDIQSSNIKHTEYDTETKSLEVIFRGLFANDQLAKKQTSLNSAH